MRWESWQCFALGICKVNALQQITLQSGLCRGKTFDTKDITRVRLPSQTLSLDRPQKMSLDLSTAKRLCIQGHYYKRYINAVLSYLKTKQKRFCVLGDSLLDPAEHNSFRSRSRSAERGVWTQSSSGRLASTAAAARTAHTAGPSERHHRQSLVCQLTSVLLNLSQTTAT